MGSKEEINRLGFEAWCDNKFVNLIEDVVMPGIGNISITNDDITMLVWWDDTAINCTIRAYTDTGWQTYEREIKR